MSLPEYQSAKAVMFYVDVGRKSGRGRRIQEALASGKKIVIPYCVDGELELFHLEVDGRARTRDVRGSLEPKTELRTVAAKKVDVQELDLIIVPGVAFDRRGGRAGHGKGVLRQAAGTRSRAAASRGIGIRCQMFPEIPMQSHDIHMDKVVTETAAYDGIGRRV